MNRPEGRPRQTRKQQKQLLPHAATQTFNGDKLNASVVENDTSSSEMRYARLPENEDDYDRPLDIVPVYEAEPEEEYVIELQTKT